METTGFDLPHLAEVGLLARLAACGLDRHPLVRAALAHAKIVHGSQKRDDGSPYLTQHIYPVAAEVVEDFTRRGQPVPPEAASGALLHDALEDDDGSLSRVEFERRFGPRVAVIVGALTKDSWTGYAGETGAEKKENRDRAYLAGLENAPAEARLIKAADRRNNIFCLHTSGKPGKVQEYLEETQELYLPYLEKWAPELAGQIAGRLKELQRLIP